MLLGVDLGMTVSNYSFKAPEEVHSPAFFDDLGKYPELKRQQSEITNYYKQYAWIQSGDSNLQMIGKIALAIITFSASLWATAILDWFTQDQRQSAFDEVVKKDKETYFGQIVNDLFRQEIHIGDENLYERGWGILLQEEIPEAHRARAQTLRKESQSFGSLYNAEKLTEEDQAFLSALYPVIQKKVKATVLPEIFCELQGKYGTLRALQVVDGMAQTISNKMANAFNTKYILDRIMPQDVEGPLSNGCFTSGGLEQIDRKTHQITLLDLNNGMLKLDRGLLLWTPGGADPRVLAEVRIQFGMEFSEFTGGSVMSMTMENDAIGRDEAIKLNEVWREFQFQMPVPAA